MVDGVVGEDVVVGVETPVFPEVTPVLVVEAVVDVEAPW